MNFKKTAIALAVASVAAAPIVASADGSVYASARIGLQYRDAAGVDDITVRGYGSRMGIKGETDLGNGLTAWGKYEFAVNTESNASTTTVRNAAGTGTTTVTDRDQTISRRHAVVGVKGAFGNVFLGQTYHTWYNYITGGADYPWWGSGYAMVQYRGRTDNGLSYAGDFGPVSVGLTAYLQGSGSAVSNPQGGNTSNGGAASATNSNETLDEFELAVSFDAGPVRLGAGLITFSGRDATAAVGSPEPENIIGLSASGTFGPVYVAGNYMQQDDHNGVGNDGSSITLHVGVADFYGHIEQEDNDAGGDPTYITLGYTLNLGPRTLMYFEISDLDDDVTGNAGDHTIGRATLKYDIL